MKRIGAAWDNPAPTRDFLENTEALELTSHCLAADLSSKPLKEFLGLKRFLKTRSLARLDQPWGWKDPRTVFTLPAWLRVFPSAKLLYIVRNGVDVASSLQVREVRELARRREELAQKSRQLNRHSMLERAGFKGSARCLTLAGGFSLWEEYVAEAERLLSLVQNERLVLIRKKTDLPNPAVYALDCSQQFPVEETLLPVAKRFLVKFITDAA